MTSAAKLPTWVAERINPMPPVALRSKSAPEWTATETATFAPAGKVWDRDGQRWI